MICDLIIKICLYFSLISAMNSSEYVTMLLHLNQEINHIVKYRSQNDTSYFPNRQNLIKSFQQYLSCIGIHQDVQSTKILYSKGILLFKQEVSSTIISKYPRLLYLIQMWNFLFSEELKFLLTKQINKQNLMLFALKEVSLVEIILIMYLALQIERQEIFGTDLQSGPKKNFFLLKQILKIMEQFKLQTKDYKNQPSQQRNSKSFQINQDKLIKILLLKSLKIKLKGQNIRDKNCLEHVQKTLNWKAQEIDENDNLLDSQEFKQNLLEKNFSLISVQSQFYDSNLFMERMRKSIDQNLNGQKQKIEKINILQRRDNNSKIYNQKNVESRHNLEQQSQYDNRQYEKEEEIFQYISF